MTPDPNEGPMHTWKGGLKIYRNKNSTAIRDDCKDMVESIRIKKYPSEFKESLYDWCIWKYTTCEFVFSINRGEHPQTNDNNDRWLWGDKYAARYYSEGVWQILEDAPDKASISGLQFDLVLERKDLRDEISKNETKTLTKLFEKYVCCVVLKTEHTELTRRSKAEKLTGWERYEGKVIYVYCDEKKTYCKCQVVKGKLVDCEPIH